MADIDWQSYRACGRNERGPKLLTQPRPSNRNEHIGGATMAVNANITVRGDSASGGCK